MQTLPLSTVINVSVSQPNAGLAPFQVNNLCIITSETPLVTLSTTLPVYVDTSAVATDWGTTSEVYSLAQSIFAQSPNILSGGGKLTIFKKAQAEDTLITSINAVRAIGYVGGFLSAGATPANAEVLVAAADAQSNGYFVFAPTHQASDLTTGGLGPLVVAGNYSRCRVLYYSTSAILARKFAAAYAGRAMSTDFTGSNTSMTMELKDLATIQPDAGVTLSVYQDALAAGADVYVNTAGLPKVRTSGANSFFDSVYNLNWFVGALSVAGFNALSRTSTKIPQTEQGMTFFKRQFRDVCTAAVRNGFVAPGVWSSPDTFGSPEVFHTNILTYGYYVYSVPVVYQNPVDRAARKAPLVQIAIKEAGALHSGTILVNINE